MTWVTGRKHNMSKLEGISVRLPLAYSSQDGPYALNKTILEAVKQNFKNLLLTSPGERVMLPDFGAGIKRLLFEPINSRTFSRVSQAIYAQVDKYMPFINIEDIQFTTYEIDPSLALNEVQLVVNYNLGSIDSSNTLKISQVND
jgi:phage baseplate assembly protein W